MGHPVRNGRRQLFSALGAAGVGASQIVFGTDAPFVDGAPQVQGLQRAGLSTEELRGIERDNAARIVPRLLV
jgi:predicted TIM-barrel fold metal-dependent hydrolase